MFGGQDTVFCWIFHTLINSDIGHIHTGFFTGCASTKRERYYESIAFGVSCPVRPLRDVSAPT